VIISYQNLGTALLFLNLVRVDGVVDEVEQSPLAIAFVIVPISNLRWAERLLRVIRSNLSIRRCYDLIPIGGLLLRDLVKDTVGGEASKVREISALVWSEFLNERLLK